MNIPNIIVQYPPEFNCYEKFSRKLDNILKNVERATIYYYQDSSRLIEKWLESKSGMSRKVCDFDSVPVSELTHAITFMAKDGLHKPLDVPDIPCRKIVVPITRVVNKDRGDEYDVYIGRGTKWGNPYAVGFGEAPGEENSREEAIRKYAYDFSRGFLGDKNFMKALVKLQGKRLACHCKPLACHGDVLAEYLNALDDGT